MIEVFNLLPKQECILNNPPDNMLGLGKALCQAIASKEGGKGLLNIKKLNSWLTRPKEVGQKRAGKLTCLELHCIQ